MRIWPDPSTATDWKTWAQRLYKVLLEADPKQVAKTVAYTVATVPPPIEDGMIVFITNETGGKTLAVSYGTQWLRVKDGAPIA